MAELNTAERVDDDDGEPWRAVAIAGRGTQALYMKISCPYFVCEDWLFLKISCPDFVYENWLFSMYDNPCYAIL